MVLSVDVSKVPSKDGCCVVVRRLKRFKFRTHPLQFSFSSVHDPPTSREEQQYAAVAKLPIHT